MDCDYDRSTATMIAILNESDSIITVYVLFYIFLFFIFVNVVRSSYEQLNWCYIYYATMDCDYDRSTATMIAVLNESDSIITVYVLFYIFFVLYL